jgi:hypothetical protein
MGSSSPSGYNLTRSLRFRASATAYLSKTVSGVGNQQKYTYSGWIKRGLLSGQDFTLFGSWTDVNNYTVIYFANASATMRIVTLSGGTAIVNLQSAAVFRDPSAWYHFVVSVDTTQATAADRVRFYVNNVQNTSFVTNTTQPSQNANILMGVIRGVGYDLGGDYFDGYMTEINFVDGQALTPSSFGSTNALTGVWQPARYTGTYGTNGFYLPFTDNSALTTSSNVGLGKDFSGNANYWVTNNISITAGVTYDSMTDVPTLTSATAANFAVANPLSVGANTALTNGNLSGTLTGSGGWSATICGLTSGKWYYEATVTANSGNSMWIGFISDAYTKNDNAWSYGTQIALYANDARNGNNGGYGASWTTNDVIGVALDLSTSSGSITFYKNGVSQGVMFSSLTSSAVWRPLVSGGGTGTTIAMNFGQRPFSYTPPTGFVALNTYNLPTSTIVKGNTVMDATTYTGTGATLAVTNAGGFKPDLVWIKSRAQARSHRLQDSVRGVGNRLASDLTAAETVDTSSLTSFDTGGFSLGTNINYNTSAETFVGWQWQAGQGSSSSNTNGSITSTVSVNASAGFSVVTYTGTALAGTIGHGLGVAPQLIIVKPRSATITTDAWNVYHVSTGNTNFLVLNATDASTAASNRWNNTSPTSSVFSIGTVPSSVAVGYVAYCWTPIAGFSAFGSYTGNGSADGPFVYFGFRPKWIMIKSSSAVGNWVLLDTSRGTYNAIGPRLYADLSDAEYTGDRYDILSNGLKIRTTSAESNSSGATYIYAAFAENPFKNALAR